MNCAHCKSNDVIRKSFYFVKHSRSYIRRYLCKSCRKTFSSKTMTSTYRHKKPFLNIKIFNLLSNGNTQRGIARLLGCTKNTVSRKFQWLYLNKTELRINLNNSINTNCHQSFSPHIQIDEQESIEHTKLKPVTIPICVDSQYKIISVQTGAIRAKGHLAKISLRKYGYRKCQREKALKDLFLNIKESLKQDPISITTDSSPHYLKLVRTFFPNSKHIRVVSRDKTKKKKELMFTAEQKKLFDPMFAINQRCAKLRADIRRLTRRSWCTTKKIDNLQKHLELYQIFNNNQLAI